MWGALTDTIESCYLNLNLENQNKQIQSTLATSQKSIEYIKAQSDFTFIFPYCVDISLHKKTVKYTS